MKRRTLGLLVAAILFGSAGCGRQIDLATALSVSEVFSGYYDFGIVKGENKLVPSISFKLKNVSAAPVTQVQVIVSFWPKGADGEKDSKEVTGIGGTAVAAGSSSDPILVRSAIGYTLDQPRSELFTHSGFKDFTAKVFVKREGKIVPLGEFTIEHRIIPHVDEAPHP
jgi:hypothetical protein